MRIQFQKSKQKEFFNKILKNLNIPSIKELSKRIEISYSTLRSYYNENRTLPKELFIELSKITKINISETQIKFLEENWGQSKGGKISKRNY